MFFEDRRNVRRVDLRNDQFAFQFVNDALRIFRWVSIVNVQNDFLKRRFEISLLKILSRRFTSSNFFGTSDSGVHSTEIRALPPAGTVPPPGEIVNGPTGSRPCVCKSLQRENERRKQFSGVSSGRLAFARVIDRHTHKRNVEKLFCRLVRVVRVPGRLVFANCLRTHR